MYSKKLFRVNIFLLLFYSMSCQAQKSSQTSLPYDLSKPVVIELGDEVSNISGIAYYAQNHSVFAIDDDHGDLFEIPLKQQPAIRKWTVEKPEDYEDVVLHEGMIYILSSKGKVIYFPLRFPIQSPKQTALAGSGKNNFETLFKDPAANRLLLVCKECKEDSKKKTSVFAFDLNKKEIVPGAVALIHRKAVNKDLDKTEIKDLKPSAAAANPLTGEIYLLASVNKLLLILDEKLHIKEVFPLDPHIFKQPEGITFTPAGDLLISNEAGKKGKANILLFKKR